MKKTACLMLAVLLAASLFGCTETPGYEDPVRFYYLPTEQSFSSGSATIRAETREKAATGQTTEQILQVYLDGPPEEGLQSPFPRNTRLVSFSVENDTAFITLSAHFAALSGLELNLACGCFAMTCMELTGAAQVVISAENSLLDGEKSITMTKETLLLTDNTPDTQED